MNELEAFINPAELTPQERLSSRLLRASELQHLNQANEAAAELEIAMGEARATPYEIEFQTRIQLAMTLADLYQSMNQIQRAGDMLAGEVAFAEKISQIMQATGTASQKRAATTGYLQVRDRATQMRLIGHQAPEISVKAWIQGGPLTLADLRGGVVLLEFWATWCTPCREMFPKLQALYEKEKQNGLEVIALTRHYMAYRGTEESKMEELQLMRGMVVDNKVSFPVGVTGDEQLQAIYGANGLPTVVLIDCQGSVRYAGPGGEDATFGKTLRSAIAESA